MRKRKENIILGEKLRRIRLWKGISQTATLRAVLPDAIETQRSRVSQWEQGLRQPPIEAQIRYAQIAGIPLEDLLVDARQLPARLLVKHPRFKAKKPKRKSKKNKAEKVMSTQPNEPLNEPPNAPVDILSALKEIVIPPFEDEALLEAHESKREVPENENISSSQNAPAETVSVEPERPFYEALPDLPINIGSDESTEPVTLALPDKTLDSLSDMHLELQLVVPRLHRPQLTISGIVNLSVKILLDDYQKRGVDSLIVSQTALLLDQLDMLPDPSSPGVTDAP